MEPEGSLPHSQQPAICPYPQPDRSNPCLPIVIFEDTFQYYLLVFAWVFQVVAFLQILLPKPCLRLS